MKINDIIIAREFAENSFTPLPRKILYLCIRLMVCISNYFKKEFWASIILAHYVQMVRKWRLTSINSVHWLIHLPFTLNLLASQNAFSALNHTKYHSLFLSLSWSLFQWGVYGKIWIMFHSTKWSCSPIYTNYIHKMWESCSMNKIQNSRSKKSDILTQTFTHTLTRNEREHNCTGNRNSLFKMWFSLHWNYIDFIIWCRYCSGWRWWLWW